MELPGTTTLSLAQPAADFHPLTMASHWSSRLIFAHLPPHSLSPLSLFPCHRIEKLINTRSRLVSFRFRFASGQVFQSDGSFVGKFGSCGRGEGQLEHPHYIAVSNTNRVIVSDSNNHRIQVSSHWTPSLSHSVSLCLCPLVCGRVHACLVSRTFLIEICSRFHTCNHAHSPPSF